jgi:hypothetical protein
MMVSFLRMWQKSLYSLLHELLPAVQAVPLNAFLLADTYLNSPRPCASVPRLQLSRWKAVPRFQVSRKQAQAEEEAEILDAIRLEI